MSILFPDQVAEDIKQIDFKKLKEGGINGLIIDIDNTLAATHVQKPDCQMISFIDNIKGMGFKICIVSNAAKKRVEKFNEDLKLFSVHTAMKPFKKAYLKSMKIMGTKVKETAMIGDQIFTDIIGAKRLGIYTILVKPIDSNEVIFARMKRLPEKLVIRRYYKYLARKTSKSVKKSCPLK